MTYQREKWTVPAGLERTPPREVRLTANGVALIVVGVAAMIASVVSLIVLINVSREQSQAQRQLLEAGEQIEAVVSSLWRTGGENRPTWVAYRFGAYGGTARIPQRVWRNLKVGSTLPVRFVRANPSISVPIAAMRNPLPLWIAPLTALGLAAFGAILTMLVRDQMRLLAEGRPAQARITRLKKTHEGSVVHYEFRVLSGATRSGHSRPIRKPPGVGSMVSILYDSDNPRRQSIYPLSLARLRPR